MFVPWDLNPQRSLYQLTPLDPLFFNFSSHFTDALIDDVCLQSMLGRKMLEFQLRRLGTFDAEESISSHPNLDESFKLCEKFFDICVKASMLDRY